MNILGIVHPYTHDAAACIMMQQGLCAFAEEERFTRIKYQTGIPPLNAIDYCFSKTGLSLSDIDYIAIGCSWYTKILSSEILSKISTIKRRGQMVTKFSSKRYGILKQFHRAYLEYFSSMEKLPFYPSPKIHFIRHHLAHAASAFYISPFEKANIISLDGGGGEESGLLLYGEGNKMKIIKRNSSASSWGFLYSYVTQFLGFKSDADEGKVMGLAAYGNPKVKVFPFINFKKVIPELDLVGFSNYFRNMKPRKPGEPIGEFHKNLAATLQNSLDEVVLKMVKYLYRINGVKNFCIAGGVGLNCTTNGKIWNSPYVDSIFIQPANNDAGTALGSAVYLYVNMTGKRPDIKYNHAYWGPKFSNREIEDLLIQCKIKYKKSNNIAKDIAELITKNKIVGWFQGEMEVGPRALGNRSILADPRNPEMKDKVNDVKRREKWRPFAPSILKEHGPEFIENYCDSPFMIIAFKVKTEKRKIIPSVVHVDGTARIQSVDKAVNPRFWSLIQRFYRMTGVPLLLNTSFNNRGEPIVCTPSDAISAFYRMGLDALALEDFLVLK